MRVDRSRPTPFPLHEQPTPRCHSYAALQPACRRTVHAQSTPSTAPTSHTLAPSRCTLSTPSSSLPLASTSGTPTTARKRDRAGCSHLQSSTALARASRRNRPSSVAVPRPPRTQTRRNRAPRRAMADYSQAPLVPRSSKQAKMLGVGADIDQRPPGSAGSNLSDWNGWGVQDQAARGRQGSPADVAPPWGNGAEVRSLHGPLKRLRSSAVEVADLLSSLARTAEAQGDTLALVQRAAFARNTQRERLARPCREGTRRQGEEARIVWRPAQAEREQGRRAGSACVVSAAHKGL